MTNNEAIVLTFGDSIIRESDVSLLKGQHWLNDTIMSFYFEFLQTKLFKKLEKEILFVGPEVTHCIKAAQLDELTVFLDPLLARNKLLVFFILNDNQVYGQAGGTHWSLLVYCLPDKGMYHFDSLTGSNNRQAKQFTQKVFQYFKSDEGGFEEVQCLQQQNSYDCGIFVLSHAEFVTNYFLTNSTLLDCEKMSNHSITLMRQRILDLIDELK